MSAAEQGLALVAVIVIGAGILLIPLTGLTIWTVFSWKGGWRFVALLPLLAMAGLVVHLAMHPESANLWPIAIIFWGLVAMAILAVMIGAHALTERLASRSKSADDPDKPDAD